MVLGFPIATRTWSFSWRPPGRPRRKRLSMAGVAAARRPTPSGRGASNTVHSRRRGRWRAFSDVALRRLLDEPGESRQDARHPCHSLRSTPPAFTSQAGRHDGRTGLGHRQPQLESHPTTAVVVISHNPYRTPGHARRREANHTVHEVIEPRLGPRQRGVPLCPSSSESRASRLVEGSVAEHGEQDADAVSGEAEEGLGMGFAAGSAAVVVVA